MPSENELSKAEHRVEERSAVFKKELGLRDLVLTQILFVVGLSWVGTAGKLGPSHIVFWLLAIIFFYIPSAVIVIYLNRLMPLEGGLYQWAKLGLNSFIGFLVGWNLWIYVIVLTSEVGLQVATNLSYAIGPKAAWLAGSKPFITLISIMLIGMLVLVSTLGLGVGKWVHNAGGILILLAFAALVSLPLLGLYKGTITSYHPFATTIPAISLLNLNILGKMGFGAMGGFEYVAVFAGECRNPARTIGRSVLIAAPVIALMFILGTSSVLAFVRPEDIDLIGPIPQVLALGFRPFTVIAALVPVVIVSLLGVRIGQASVNFTANTRLPMVAGWDNLLPKWFTRLHPRRKTPVNSIIFVGAMTLSMGIAGIVGVGEQEAYQLLQNASGIFYALTYLALFLIPIIGLRNAGVRLPVWLKIVSASGFMMTLLYVVLSVFPIIQVASRLAFTIKITSVILGANLVGAAIFFLARRGNSTPANN